MDISKIKAVMVVVLVAVLSGCVGMADSMSKMAGMGVVSKEVSAFDGATIVEVSPYFLGGPDSMSAVSVKLGARWSSNQPDLVALILKHDGSTSGFRDTYVSIVGMDINVDGAITKHKAAGLTSHDHDSYNTVTQTIYTESTNHIALPLAMLRSMVSAKDCKVRVYTNNGYEDAVFSMERIPGGQGTAILSIKEFLAAIDGL